MSFCIVEGKVKRIKDTPKYIEVENITSLSISNKGAIANSDMLSKFDLSPQANPNNINYNLLSATINKAKSLHIPKKSRIFNKRRLKKEPWRTNDLLVFINKKTICIETGSLQLVTKSMKIKKSTLKLMTE